MLKWKERTNEPNILFEHSSNVFFSLSVFLFIDLLQTCSILACINKLSIRPLILLCIFRNTIRRNSLGFRYMCWTYLVSERNAWYVSPKWNSFSRDHNNCQSYIYKLHTFAVWHLFQNDGNLRIFHSLYKMNGMNTVDQNFLNGEKKSNT